MNIKDEMGKKETLYTHSFIMSSLAGMHCQCLVYSHQSSGMLFLGVTGMKAAISHSPLENDRKKFLFFAFPHIGLSDSGQFGEACT